MNNERGSNSQNDTKQKNSKMNNAKSNVKNKIKTKIIKIIMKVLTPIILIILAAAIVLGIFGAVIDAVGEALSGIGGAIGGAVQGVVDFFTVDSNDGSIEIDADKIDLILEEIENIGVNPEDLKLLGDYDENASEVEKKLATIKYLKKFYEAQAITQTLNYYHFKTNGDNVYGAIYVYRANEDDVDGTNRKKLYFTDYDKMKKAEETGDPAALDYFSIDDSGNLIIAAKYQTIKETGSSEENLNEVSNETTITLKNIDYKSELDKYTTKINFLISLTMISQNPEFVSAVVDLIKDTRIEITIMDNVSTYESIQTHKYDLNTRTKHEIKKQGQINEYYTNSTQPGVTDVIKETIIETKPQINITYVKTWFYEQKNSYSKTTVGPDETINDPITIKNETAITGNNEGSWKTNYTINSKDISTTSEYITIPGEGKYILGEVGDAERYENKDILEPTFIGLMETEFRIPYSTREEAAGSNLVSGAEMLFYLLQKDSSLENMEIVMRYALYLYSGKDYGVTSLDGSIFEIQDFNTVTSLYGGTIQEKVWFALKDMGLSEYAIAGVMGNIEGESGFNTGSIEIGSQEGIGLCQWSFGRRDALEAYATSKGRDWQDEDIQIEFLIGELTIGGGANGYATYQLMNNKGYTVDNWKNATTPEEAAVAFCWIFERPSVPRLPERESAAKKYYEEFKGKEKYNVSVSALLEAVDNVSKYLVENNYTYSSTGDTTYTFPIAQNGLRTLSCSSFVQECLLQAGYLQCEGREKLWARMNIQATKSDFDRLGIPVEIITDLNTLQPGDILQYRSIYHVVIVYSVSGNKVTIKGVPEVLNNNSGFNGVTRTVDYLKQNNCYAVRIKSD